MNDRKDNTRTMSNAEMDELDREMDQPHQLENGKGKMFKPPPT